MTRFFAAMIACNLVTGCAVRSSSFSPLPVVIDENVQMHSEGLPDAQIGCGWVVVQEKTVTRLFGVPLSTDERQFEESLFYCCPGTADPDPRCYQAIWYARQGD